MRYVPAGFVDMRDLVGTLGITDQEAHRRQRTGEVWVRPRPARKGLVPLTMHDVLAAVNAGTFPAPVQIQPGQRLWRRTDVLRWLAEQNAHQS